MRLASGQRETDRQPTGIDDFIESWSSVRRATGPSVVHCCQQCRLHAGARARRRYQSFARPHHGLRSMRS